jgi:hypothetical protein
MSISFLWYIFEIGFAARLSDGVGGGWIGVLLFQIFHLIRIRTVSPKASYDVRTCRESLFIVFGPVSSTPYQLSEHIALAEEHHVHSRMYSGRSFSIGSLNVRTGGGMNE